MKPIKRDLAGRVHLIDEVRGFAIIMMVVYHTFFDLVVIFGVKIPAFYSPLVQGLVILFAGLFIFISGAACHFSHSNLRRGIVCFCLGLALTAGTVLFMPDERILFGILHLLGASMLLFPLFAPLLRRLPPLAGMLGYLALFALLYHVPDGYVGWKGFFSLPLPRGIYDLHGLFWLGFPGSGFFSSDYFPLIPWSFCFAAGAFFGVLVKGRRLPGWVYAPHCPPLAFVGRNTLIVYLLHQPVVYGVLWAVFALLPG